MRTMLADGMMQMWEMTDKVRGDLQSERKPLPQIGYAYDWSAKNSWRPVTVLGHICTHLGPAELLEEAGVGVEAGRVEDRVLSSMEPQEVI